MKKNSKALRVGAIAMKNVFVEYIIATPILIRTPIRLIIRKTPIEHTISRCTIIDVRGTTCKVFIISIL